MPEDRCCYEVNFELASQPIEINLELLHYTTKDSTYATLTFEDTDWVISEEDNTYSIFIEKSSLGFISYTVLNIYLYNTEDNTYEPSLLHYTIDDNDNLTLYSEEPYKCQVNLLGRIK